MSEPVCTEVTVSASVGGKVQIVKFEYTADFHYSQSRRYSIPEGWSDEQVAEFQNNATADLRAEIEKAADAEMKDLLEQRDNA